MPKLLLAGTFHPDINILLNDRADVEVVILVEPTEQELIDAIPGFDGLVLRTTQFGAEACAKADKLKIISRHGVGYDNVDVKAATANGLPLAVVGEANSNAVCEHAFMLMLATMKDALPLDNAVRKQDYARRNAMTSGEVADKTILIVGFGRIGTRMARR